MKNNVIIGAGITGLSFAYFSKHNNVILEKSNKPGGLCSSVEKDGFTFDHAGHFLHVHNPFTERLIKDFLIPNLLLIERNAWIHTHNTLIPFPFQANLFNLPDDVKKECLEGFLNKKKPADAKDFYSWSVGTFGSGITRHFMKPYNEKLWTVSSKTLTSDWAAPFVPAPERNEVIEGTVRQSVKLFGYNPTFYYPKHGGSNALISAFHNHISNINFNEEVISIDSKNRLIETDKGEHHYDNLISTQPLVKLLEQIPDLPQHILNAKEKLIWNSVYCLNLGVAAKDKQIFEGKHWTYFPEDKYIFYRAGIYSNINPNLAPANHASFYIEISRKPEVKFDKIKALKEIISGLRHAGILSQSNKITTKLWMDMPFAYVIYDKYRTDALKEIHSYLKRNNIYSIGRYGAWKYSFMEESILDAKKLTKELEKG